MKRLVTVLAICMLLCGCGTTYRYAGKSYYSSGDAIAAYKKDLDACKAKIIPANNTIGGTAVVVLPSKSYIVNNGISGEKDSLPPEMVEYILNYTETCYASKVDAIKKRNIFGNVETQRSDRPERTPASDANFVLYLTPDAICRAGLLGNNPYVTALSPDSGRWFLKLPGDNNPRPIYVDRSNPDCTACTLSWLDYIEKTAATRPPAVKAATLPAAPPSTAGPQPPTPVSASPTIAPEPAPKPAAPAAPTELVNPDEPAPASAATQVSAPMTPQAAKGEVYIGSEPPSADIYINGGYVATTPADLSLDAGDYTMAIIKDGCKPTSVRLTVKEGVNTPLNLRLNPR